MQFHAPFIRFLRAMLFRADYEPGSADAVAPVNAIERSAIAVESKSAEIWPAMLVGLQDAAIVLDRDKMVLVANADANALFDAEPGRHIAQISRSPELLSGVDRALATPKAVSFEMRVMIPVERRLTTRVTPLGGIAAGEPALLVVFRDHTEQDRLYRMRADFVANASHELRTPLASLKGFVETLQTSAKDDPVARARFLTIMQTQAERMSRLIDDLLSLSRIEMRQHVPPRDIVDFAAVTSTAALALQSIAKTANVIITVRPVAGPARVIGDAEELTQVVQNLMQNAIKYGQRGGHVDVAITEVGSKIVLKVTDDGIGISPEHLPRLTERFYRVSAKDSRDRGGTGLGLAIVKHIVSRHHGELQITSEVGKGSVFTVILPAARLAGS